MAGLVGIVEYSNATISDSYAAGDVTNTSNKRTTSGLVGSAGPSDYSIEINNSYSTGDIEGDIEVAGLLAEANDGTLVTDSRATGQIKARSRIAGGLVANGLSGSTISQSYFDGSVVADRNVGGISAKSGATIENTYVTGEIIFNSESDSIDGNAGGIVGKTSDNATITNSVMLGSIDDTFEFNSGRIIGNHTGGSVAEDVYWNTSTTGPSGAFGSTGTTEENGEIIGYTESELTGSSAESNLSQLDFTNIWKTNSDSFPTLQE